MLDLLIHGAEVCDGDSLHPRRVAVGVVNDRIVHVGEKPSGFSAHESMDAAGLVLCPGFIDTHSSTGLTFLYPRSGDNKLSQGITTEIFGNCGTSQGPVGELLVPVMEKLDRELEFGFDWRSLEDFHRRLEREGLPFNVAGHVGHGTLRAGAMLPGEDYGGERRERMLAMLDQGLRDGAIGLSTGLVYAPGSFADTAEIIDLAKVVARHGGIYVSHVRDERHKVDEAVAEAIEVGRSAGISVLVSHLKSAERANWGRIPSIIGMVEDARGRMDTPLSFEVYPYTAVSTKLRTFIPREIMDGGIEEYKRRLTEPDWRERCRRYMHERGTDFAAMMLLGEHGEGSGKSSVASLATRHGNDPGLEVVDILLRDPDTWIVYHCIDQSDVDAAVLWPDSIICSDSWSHPFNAPKQIGDPHPRTFGAFTRFLEQYVIRAGQLSMAAAVRKATALAADFTGIRERGRIREDCFADIVLLDPMNIRELATYEQPRQLSTGTEFVWVNGRPAVERGVILDSRHGRVLRHGR
ncbi:amidohydrolase family protein [bacterium]|nr:amidohydrolase family protein [bacterium]